VGGQVEDEGHAAALKLVIMTKQVVPGPVLRIEQGQLLVQLNPQHLKKKNA
jgi:hypothetical protein